LELPCHFGVNMSESRGYSIRRILGEIMQIQSAVRSIIPVGCLVAAMLSGGAALAQGHAGGGGHFGGGGHAAVAHGGYGGGYHGGYGGYRGGYGYGGYRGGYGWRGGYYGGWGWGGLGLGLYFATLPLYYSTLWWEGVPYYYADDTYYRYDGSARQYVTVAPPAEVQSQNGAQEPVGTDLIAYPKNGQSAEQQAKDKYECHHWATTQSGFDPTQGATATASPLKRTDYMRAQAACLDGRGYSVK
jgi:hypothetical protein